MRTSRRVLFAALFLMMAGCSVVRNLKLDARMPLPPAIKRIPIRMGLFYSPEFLAATKIFEFRCHQNERTDIFYFFPLGLTSRDLFDQITGYMFASVTSLSRLEPTSDRKPSLDGILELRLDSFDWKPFCTKEKTYHISAKIQFIVNLYDPDGRLVFSSGFSGAGSERPKPCLSGCKDSIAAERAIQDAMAGFMLNFIKQPTVQAWLSTKIPPEGRHP